MEAELSFFSDQFGAGGRRLREIGLWTGALVFSSAVALAISSIPQFHIPMGGNSPLLPASDSRAVAPATNASPVNSSFSEPTTSTTSTRTAKPQASTLTPDTSDHQAPNVNPKANSVTQPARAQALTPSSPTTAPRALPATVPTTRPASSLPKIDVPAPVGAVIVLPVLTDPSPAPTSAINASPSVLSSLIGAVFQLLDPHDNGSITADPTDASASAVAP